MSDKKSEKRPNKAVLSAAFVLRKQGRTLFQSPIASDDNPRLKISENTMHGSQGNDS